MQIRELLTQGIPVFVDMQDVSFVDSSGLGMLVCLEKEARTFQVPFILINPSTQVRNSLRVARLDKILHIESTLDKAENECVDPRQWFVKKTVKPGPGVLRIWLEGRIDASVQKEFEEVLHYHVSGIHEIQRLELDLSSVTFIDSAGLIVLIKLHKQLIRKSGGLYIVQSSEIVQKILRVMRMDQYLGKSEKKAHFQQYTRGSF
jgi:N-acetylglucosaminyldiphosphoundecaprenol N-acetyl-beta-D-mannosaminyltransferase